MILALPHLLLLSLLLIASSLALTLFLRMPATRQAKGSSKIPVKASSKNQESWSDEIQSHAPVKLLPKSQDSWTSKIQSESPKVVKKSDVVLVPLNEPNSPKVTQKRATNRDQRKTCTSPGSEKKPLRISPLLNGLKNSRNPSESSRPNRIIEKKCSYANTGDKFVSVGHTVVKVMPTPAVRSSVDKSTPTPAVRNSVERFNSMDKIPYDKINTPERHSISKFSDRISAYKINSAEKTGLDKSSSVDRNSTEKSADTNSPKLERKYVDKLVLDKKNSVERGIHNKKISLERTVPDKKTCHDKVVSDKKNSTGIHSDRNNSVEKCLDNESAVDKVVFAEGSSSDGVSDDGLGKLASLSESVEESVCDSGDSAGITQDLTVNPGLKLFGALDTFRKFRSECQIFFRVGVLPHLESQRDERLADRIVCFQAHCRGYLARKQFAKRKVEQLAVRCIQRNVRKFLSVRDWPWWRLLVRVMPLLNVHRTEEELRAKTEELDNLKHKFEKIEQEKSVLKLETSKLEAKLSELTMDLAEEHSSATLANQRLKIESAEKSRLEKELDEIQRERKHLQESSERLEMELLCQVNGTGVGGNGEGEEEYRQRYERAARELEFTRRRLSQQHQDDLEQLVALKKQLEKKLSDSYEEVEEQRQVVGQWKRKVQKLTSEMSDLKLLLEKQNSRNDMLEKKQRKFDMEIQQLTDELRQEKSNKERTMREKELAIGDKYTMEQNLSALKLELDMKEQKVISLTSEINELSFGGNTEEEIGQLKKAKHQLTNKVKEQEEELDDLAGQVQLLETAKLRLEMSLEQIRKENKKELAQRDEELEEVRCNAHKKVKALECQLENEHEERTVLLRERHEMERRLAEYEDQSNTNRNNDQEMLQKLRRDLKRTKALLRDAQTTIEQSRTDTPNKALIRQLRNQLEDAECARAAAVKARQATEGEHAETVAAMEDAVRTRSEAEDRASALMRERSQLQSQLDENEEELAEVLKKYRSTVQQLSTEQKAMQEQADRVSELEQERASLREQLANLSTRVESMETLNDPSSSIAVKRLQLKTKELESKLELEQTTRSRMEVQITRLKDNNERLQSDIEIIKGREYSAQEKVKASNRQTRELREEHTLLASKEHEAQAKIKELEKRLETTDADAAAARADLRLALTRIEDLQCAIQGDLEDGEDNSGASSDSDSSIRSDELMSTADSLSLRLRDSAESSYQSADRSSSQLRKFNDSMTKDSSLA